MLVLPFFLLVVFTVMLVAFAVIRAEMATYATFWGSRAAAVGPDYQQAAQEALPRILVNPDTDCDGYPKCMRGTYDAIPVLGIAGDALNAPMADLRYLKTWVPLHVFPPKKSCDRDTNDNPIGYAPCYYESF